MLIALAIPNLLMAASPDDQAREILQQTKTSGGFIVHLGCTDGLLSSALKASDAYQIHALSTEQQHVDQVRKLLLTQNQYGAVTADKLSGKRLPYIDNLVNLLVASDASGVSKAEMLRVLVPNGRAHIRQDGQWKTIQKPRPENIDDWTHFMHDASGNAVAADSVVGPPRHLQWLGSPRWSRHHDRMASMSALVSNNGRLFYIMDEGSRVSIQMPAKWTLVARDAFNGTVLWKQPIPDWQSHLWPLKSGPTNLARRLVAVGDYVYVTLGYAAPVTKIDAADGKILKTFLGTGAAEELIVDGGTVISLVNEKEMELAKFAPQFNTGDQKRVATEFQWNQEPRNIVASDAETGEQLWKYESKVAPLSLSASNNKIFFHDGEKVVCLDQKSGELAWKSEPAGRRPNVTFNFGPKMVIYDDIVLFAGGDRTMRALDMKTGEQLWSAPHARGGYQSPEDMLVLNDLVFSAPTTSGKDSGVFTGRDVRTGEVKVEFPPNVETYWFHHRCYIAKATEKFLLPSRTGVEFVDYKTKDWDIHHWVRGGCLYGVMPCNGLLYAPPHNCACYPEAKLYGFNALAPARKIEVDNRDRLELGPAAGRTPTHNPSEKNWPTYRGDAKRSGFADVSIDAQLGNLWKTKLGGKLTAMTMAAGKVYVGQTNTHTLFALDANTGETVWTFTAGGRIDSPPTFDKGRLFLGAADGYVYCIDAQDGQLAWRFRAAPADQRLMSFEQLESVWPVHGSILVQDDSAFFIAGRSNFLDGGLYFYRIDATTGKQEVVENINSTDPETGGDIQDRLKILQMPAGLSDVLSSDGKNIYMRSQRFDKDGKRYDVGPVSGDFAAQGGSQGGETAHLFSPTGFLDDTYFHRSYWVYGRNFAGGHGGYFQAGKYAPGGRIIVHDDEKVYAFGRKPEYLKWTTTIEHQLYSANKNGPKTEVLGKKPGGKGGTPAVKFALAKHLDPTGKPITIETWVRPEKPNSVILARGGPAQGYSLWLGKRGQPIFSVCADGKVWRVVGKGSVVGSWNHVVAVLQADKSMQIYVNGKQVGRGVSESLLTSNPVQSLEIGADYTSSVGDEYPTGLRYTGLIDDVRVYYGALDAEAVAARHNDPTHETKIKPVLVCSFDKANANDDSGNEHHGEMVSVTSAPGKNGRAMKFAAGQNRGNKAAANVEHDWNTDLPLYARAMMLTKDKIFIAGPPDLIDEEDTFQRLTQRDPEVQKQLNRQDAALQGREGGIMAVIDKKTGKIETITQLESLPAWDGMATYGGKVFITTEDGKILCLEAIP
jgi:outer membrane protein assembly factor BamB